MGWRDSVWLAHNLILTTDLCGVEVVLQHVLPPHQRRNTNRVHWSVTDSGCWGFWFQWLFLALLEGGIRPVIAVSSCATAAGLHSSSSASMFQRIIAFSPALQLNQSWPRVNHSWSYYRAKRETHGMEGGVCVRLLKSTVSWNQAIAKKDLQENTF